MEADRAGITLGTTGMYKAGRDMEPGTYRITPLPWQRVLRPYNDVRYYYDYIDEYAALFEPVTVNIAEGSIWSFLMPDQSSGCLTESGP